MTNRANVGKPWEIIVIFHIIVIATLCFLTRIKVNKKIVANKTITNHL